MAAAMIKLGGVSKRYRSGRADTQVLFDVDLEIAGGEYVAIVGTSGSGKSTLLNIIGGLDSRYQGEAQVAGNTLSELGDRQLSKFRNSTIGFVFQQFNLLEHLSCAENVAMPAIFSRQSEAEAEARAAAALERVGLRDRARDLAANLSGGQKQRVAIARALYNDPRILLCDEPTGNLDTRTGQQIIELFQALNSEGITLVIVTHEARVSSTAHRVIRLEDGRVVDRNASGVAVGIEADADQGAGA